MRSTLILSLLFFISFGCYHEQNSNFKQIKSPAAQNSFYPRLFTDNTGSVFMSWMEANGNQTSLKYSQFDGNNWMTNHEIASDSTWFINWADYPSLIARDGKPLAAHWLQKVDGGTYAYHINMAVFDDQWNPPFTPHNDNTPTEHGFVSMIPASDSTFAAIWLDGRETSGRAHHEYADLSKAMTLRGAIINNRSEIIDDFLIDESVCDCCNTSITKTDIGFIAAYRDRTGDEIRDIYVSSYVDGKWTEAKPVYDDNWKIAACPVNGPAIDASGSFAAVAWFTGAEGVPHVQLAISEDYGQSFKSPISLEEETPLGRTDLVINNDKIWVSWLSNLNNETSFEIRSYSFEGKETASYSISELSGQRKSGFPQITALEDGIIIAFTDVSEKGLQVKTMLLQ